MKKNKYVVVMDLDDTLLTTKKKISLKTFKCLKKLKKKGYILVLATGRIYSSCTDIIKKLFFIDYLITESGSRIYDIQKNELIYEECLSNNDLNYIFSLYNDDFYYVDFSNSYYYYIYTKNDINTYNQTVRIKDIKELYNCNITHATIYLKKNNYNKLLKEINNYENIKAFIMKDSCDSKKWLEIVKKDVSKYNALKRIIGMEEIDTNNTIAFGDSINDLEMMVNCNYSVAMGNAIKDIKKSSKFITKSCDNDGIAYFFNKVWKRRYYENNRWT